MKKIELLAPAGNLESLLAAVHSGADRPPQRKKF